MLLQLRRFLCGLRGHDTLFHFEACHVSVVCVKCGYESPGWVVPGAATSPARVRRQARDPHARDAHARDPQAPLIRQRRVA